MGFHDKMVSPTVSNDTAADLWIAVFAVVAVANVPVIASFVIVGRQELQQTGAGTLSS
jgi:hypothetical protein